MEHKKGQKRFRDCLRDSLGITLIINQAAALIVAFIALMIIFLPVLFLHFDFVRFIQ